MVNSSAPNAKATPNSDPGNQSSTESRPSNGKGFGGHANRLKLIGFVLGLVTVEAVAAYFILPTSSDAKSPAQEGVAETAGIPGAPSPISVPETQVDPTQGLGNTPGPDDVEVDLGQFSITAYQPTSQTTLRIDFHLWGTVDRSLDQEFQAAWAKNINRLRDQIIVIVRSADLSDLTDAGLGLIKRKILEKVNHTLGKPYLRTVVFSEYSFLEQ